MIVLHDKNNDFVSKQSIWHEIKLKLNYSTFIINFKLFKKNIYINNNRTTFCSTQTRLDSTQTLFIST